MAVVDPSWMPPCSMQRVICHWTAGPYNASAHDRQCYHILIQGDNTLVRGAFSIADNANTSDGKYAAHTLHCNRGSIGVTICSMAGARQKPFNPGPAPMKKSQWELMASVVAELCENYNIDVTPKTVLGHGEVQSNLGIAQKQKWDPMVLPWDPSMSMKQVGNAFRDEVKARLGAPVEDTPVKTHLLLMGKTFDAQIEDGTTHTMIRPVSDAFGWTIDSIDKDKVVLIIAGKKKKLPCEILDNRGFVACRELGEALGLEVSWDAATSTVRLG